MSIAKRPSALGVPEIDSLWQIPGTSEQFVFGDTTHRHGASAARAHDREGGLAAVLEDVLDVSVTELPWRVGVTAPVPGDDAHTAPIEPEAERGTPGVGTTEVARSNVAYVDGLLSGVKWNSLSISYSNPDSVADYQSGYPSADFKNFLTLGAHQLYATHAALNTEIFLPGRQGGAGFSIEGLTNLNIDYAGQGSGAGTLRLGNNSNSNTAHAYYPAASDTGGDVWFGASGRGPEAGNYDYSIVLHEIGHALGLKHGHEAGGYGPLPFDSDSMEYSVMTYRSFVGFNAGGYSNETWGYAQTYMMYDIAALQHMYGADFTTNAGDTLYSWNPTTGTTLINGQTAISPGGNRIFQTVWDGGGTDLYELSSYSTDLRIDLNPGGHSTFSRAQLAYLGGGPNNGYARGNVFNALQYRGDTRSLIENANGGSGNDDMLGNAANNVLSGNRGDDDLTGFAGNDILLGGDGDDWLDGHIGADSMNGGAGNDICYVDNAGDTVVEAFGDVQQGGVDLVFSYLAHTLGFGLDNLTLLSSANVNGTGNELANVIDGGSGGNALLGLAGNDTLRGYGGDDSLHGGDGNDKLLGGEGADELRGGAGNDILQGGLQTDILIGGLGNDVFDFDTVTSTPPGARDIIRAGDGATAFQGAGAAAGDRIDVSGIDANTAKGGNQAFIFGGKAIGQIWAVSSGADTLIRCNIDKDAAWEFELAIEDGVVLASAYGAVDFFL